MFGGCMKTKKQKENDKGTLQYDKLFLDEIFILDNKSLKETNVISNNIFLSFEKQIGILASLLIRGMSVNSELSSKLEKKLNYISEKNEGEDALDDNLTSDDNLSDEKNKFFKKFKKTKITIFEKKKKYLNNIEDELINFGMSEKNKNFMYDVIWMGCENDSDNNNNNNIVGNILMDGLVHSVCYIDASLLPYPLPSSDGFNFIDNACKEKTENYWKEENNDNDRINGSNYVKEKKEVDYVKSGLDFWRYHCNCSLNDSDSPYSTSFSAPNIPLYTPCFNITSSHSQTISSLFFCSVISLKSVFLNNPDLYIKIKERVINEMNLMRRINIEYLHFSKELKSASAELENFVGSNPLYLLSMLLLFSVVDGRNINETRNDIYGCELSIDFSEENFNRNGIIFHFLSPDEFCLLFCYVLDSLPPSTSYIPQFIENNSISKLSTTDSSIIPSAYFDDRNVEIEKMRFLRRSFILFYCLFYPFLQNSSILNDKSPAPILRSSILFKHLSNVIYDSNGEDESITFNVSPLIKNYSNLIKLSNFKKINKIDERNLSICDEDLNKIGEEISEEISSSKELSLYITDLNSLDIYYSPSFEELLWVLKLVNSKEDSLDNIPQTVHPPQLLLPSFVSLPLSFHCLREYLHSNPFPCKMCKSSPSYTGLCIVCGKIICLSCSCCKFECKIECPSLQSSSSSSSSSSLLALPDKSILYNKKNSCFSEEIYHSSICCGYILTVSSSFVNSVIFQRFLLFLLLF
jgi:hypothetical protein